jgi:hypothetical protein
MKSKQLFFENLIAQNALGGIPEGYNFEGKTLYQIFSDLFKEGSVFTTIALEPNAGLEFNLVNELKTKYNTLKDNNTPSQVINRLGSKPASYWKEKNIVEVLDEILFPANLATYTPTTISLTGTLNDTYYEVGTTQNNSLTLRAIKNDAGAYTNLRILRDNVEKTSVSNPTGVLQASQPQGSDYANPNVPNLKYDLLYTDSFTVNLGDNTWVGDGNYLPGLAKKNSDGVTDTRNFDTRKTTNPQAGENNFDATPISIEGIYPYYYGYSDTKPTKESIAALVNSYTVDGPSIKKALRKLNSDEQVVFGATTFQWIWIAHTGPSKNNYVTKTQSAESEIGTGAVSALFPTKETQNFSTTAWVNIPFNVYISGYKTLPVSAGSQIWFKFL